MMYLNYLWNKYYTFFKTVYQIIKVLYKAKSQVVGFSVNIITEDCINKFEQKVAQREEHLEVLKAEQILKDMPPADKLNLN